MKVTLFHKATTAFCIHSVERYIILCYTFWITSWRCWVFNEPKVYKVIGLQVYLLLVIYSIWSVAWKLQIIFSLCLNNISNSFIGLNKPPIWNLLVRIEFFSNLPCHDLKMVLGESRKNLQFKFGDHKNLYTYLYITYWKECFRTCYWENTK